jgi:glycosyltransferase involved in cell wall biosynthesis
VLLDALKCLEMKRVFCFIIGDGYMSNALKKRAVERDQTNVEFTGFVNDSILPEYYSAMDIYVLPSASSEEAFGSSVIEAMACGKPVIVSDLEWLSEVIGTDCGLLFARNDAVSLRDRLELLIGDRGLRKSMGVRARKRAVSLYGWDNVARQTDAIYREVIG